MKDLYNIDMDAKKPEVYLYPSDTVQSDMEFFGVKKWQSLNDPDWKVFKSEADAKAFLTKYNRALKRLRTLEALRPKLKGMKNFLYKRKYLAQSAIGEKLYTVRRYKKDIKVGEKFYFHDQTYALIVKLKKITQVDDLSWRYDFELVPRGITFFDRGETWKE